MNDANDAIRALERKDEVIHTLVNVCDRLTDQLERIRFGGVVAEQPTPAHAPGTQTASDEEEGGGGVQCETCAEHLPHAAAYVDDEGLAFCGRCMAEELKHAAEALDLGDDFDGDLETAFQNYADTTRASVEWVRVLSSAIEAIVATKRRRDTLNAAATDSQVSSANEGLRFQIVSAAEVAGEAAKWLSRTQPKRPHEGGGT